MTRVSSSPSPSRRGARFRSSRRGAARRPWTLLLGAILSAELVIWAGIGTDWFAWGGRSTTRTPPSPNLNPFNDSVQSVLAGINYTGNLTGYFAALEGNEICGHCPAHPFTNENFSVPVVEFRFFFNVTNSATQWEAITNFTLVTSGTDPGLFTPGGGRCCYPTYTILTGYVDFSPGQTIGLAVYAYASSLPDVGPPGFVLYFNVTSP